MITSYKNVRMITKPHFDRLEAKQQRKEAFWLIGTACVMLAIAVIVLTITGVIV